MARPSALEEYSGAAPNAVERLTPSVAHYAVELLIPSVAHYAVELLIPSRRLMPSQRLDVNGAAI